MYNSGRTEGDQLWAQFQSEGVQLPKLSGDVGGIGIDLEEKDARTEQSWGVVFISPDQQRNDGQACFAPATQDQGSFDEEAQAYRYALRPSKLLQAGGVVVSFVSVGQEDLRQDPNRFNAAMAGELTDGPSILVGDVPSKSVTVVPANG
jgi:hypothetical protein